jgi:hypothetical protein
MSTVDETIHRRCRQQGRLDGFENGAIFHDRGKGAPIVIIGYDAEPDNSDTNGKPAHTREGSHIEDAKPK